MRINGATYGFAGVVCHACHCELARRSAVVVPCAGCGTAGGRARAAGGRPLRYDGARVGREGKFCHDCVRSDPEFASAVFWRAATSAAVLPTPREILLEAWAILNEQAAGQEDREARRLEAILRGPEGGPGVSPRRAARAAIREYRATWIGRMLP